MTDGRNPVNRTVAFLSLRRSNSKTTRESPRIGYSLLSGVDRLPSGAVSIHAQCLSGISVIPCMCRRASWRRTSRRGPHRRRQSRRLAIGIRYNSGCSRSTVYASEMERAVLSVRLLLPLQCVAAIRLQSSSTELRFAFVGFAQRARIRKERPQAKGRSKEGRRRHRSGPIRARLALHAGKQ